MFIAIILLLAPISVAQEFLGRIDGKAGDMYFGFGSSGQGVAISGETIFASSTRREVFGAAHVYEKSYDDVDAWMNVATVSAFDGPAGELFGYSLAVSGETAIVTEHRYWNGASMYIFERDQGGVGTWGGVVKLSPETAENGSSVDIHGDTAIAGSAFANRTGAAYVFERDEGGPNHWGEVVELSASDADRLEPNRFGARLAIHGDTIVVAAPGHDTFNTVGSAYVFERDAGGAGNWGEIKKLTASVSDPNDAFGEDLAIFGDTMIVGASNSVIDGANTGAVYIYEKNAGGPNNWGEVVKLTPSDAVANDIFGFSVAIFGDFAVVGSVNDGDSNPDDSDFDGFGAVYVFGRNAGGPNQWGELFKLTDPHGERADYFGASLDMDGDLLVVGAPGKGDHGAVLIYRVPEPSSRTLIVLACGVVGTVVRRRVLADGSRWNIAILN